MKQCRRFRVTRRPKASLFLVIDLACERNASHCSHVVDDTPANIDVLIDMLADEFEVMVATSGAQALDVVAAHRPDLMLLDVRMPGMDGFETYRRLRAMEELDSLPVLFVTAEGDAEMAAQDSAAFRGLMAEGKSDDDA